MDQRFAVVGSGMSRKDESKYGMDGTRYYYTDLDPHKNNSHAIGGFSSQAAFSVSLTDNSSSIPSSRSRSIHPSDSSFSSDRNYDFSSPASTADSTRATYVSGGNTALPLQISALLRAREYSSGSGTLPLVDIHNYPSGFQPSRSSTPSNRWYENSDKDLNSDHVSGRSNRLSSYLTNGRNNSDYSDRSSSLLHRPNSYDDDTPSLTTASTATDSSFGSESFHSSTLIGSDLSEAQRKERRTSLYDLLDSDTDMRWPRGDDHNPFRRSATPFDGIQADKRGELRGRDAPEQALATPIPHVLSSDLGFDDEDLIDFPCLLPDNVPSPRATQVGFARNTQTQEATCTYPFQPVRTTQESRITEFSTQPRHVIDAPMTRSQTPQLSASQSIQRVTTPRPAIPFPPQRRHSDSDPNDPYQSGISSNTNSRAPSRLSRPNLVVDEGRRYSDGDQVFASLRQRRESAGRQPPVQSMAVPPRPITPGRSVRWDANLICPSPITSEKRRRGWYNKRGDQLWTNRGRYKPAPAGGEYPLELRDYPDYGEGWMNELGTRIDMMHRMVPKVPLRSALKPSRLH